jgi:hypothetical protein
MTFGLLEFNPLSTTPMVFIWGELAHRESRGTHEMLSLYLMIYDMLSLFLMVYDMLSLYLMVHAMLSLYLMVYDMLS